MNLSLLLDMAVEGFGERTVVGRAETGLSAARLRELSVGGAAVIRATRAHAVVYLAVNGPVFPVALFAAARAGVPLVPVNYRLGGEQLAALLATHPGAIGIAGTDGVARLRGEVDHVFAGRARFLRALYGNKERASARVDHPQTPAGAPTVVKLIPSTRVAHQVIAGLQTLAVGG